MTTVYFLFTDDEEALNSIMKDLAALGRCYTQHNSHKPKSRPLLYKQVHVALLVHHLPVLGVTTLSIVVLPTAFLFQQRNNRIN